jgi:hypothetical protein
MYNRRCSEFLPIAILRNRNAVLIKIEFLEIPKRIITNQKTNFLIRYLC